MPGVIFEPKKITYSHLGKMRTDDKGRKSIPILAGSKDNQQVWGAVEGYLIKIEPCQDEYEGKKIERIAFHFSDGKSTDIDCFQCGRYTAFARDVLNSLANLTDIRWVRLTPWIAIDEKTKKEYVHGSVRHSQSPEGIDDKSTKVEKKFKRGEKLEYPAKKEEFLAFINECKGKGVFPPAHVVEVAGDDVIVSKEQDMFFDLLISDISKQLTFKPVAVPSTVSDDEYQEEVEAEYSEESPF